MTAMKDLSDANGGRGTIAYNGYTLPGLRHIKINGEQVMDEAERTVIFTRYTATCLFYVFGVNESAEAIKIADIRKRLSQAGQSLELTGMGFGDIRIGGANPTHADVEWGPKPTVNSFEAFGAICHEVEWSVTFSIKECSSTSGQILEYNHEVTFSIDAGLTTRIVSGHLKIAQSRSSGGRTVQRSADTYREQLKIPVPKYFERKNQVFTPSKNKNRLDFVIVDRQLEGHPMIEGLDSESRIDYDIENVGRGFAQWMASLGGELVAVAGAHPATAAKAAFIIILDKWGKLQQMIAGNKGVVIPAKLRFGHTMGTRRSRFGMQFVITHCLDDILAKGGIWEPVTGATYEKWAASMGKAWSLRGSAGLIYNASSDAIVDLCDSTSLPAIVTESGSPNDNQFTGSGKLTDFNVPLAASWLGFENTLRAERSQEVSAHKPAVIFTPNNAYASPYSIAEQEGVTHSPSVGPATQNKDVVQFHGQPNDYVVMYGKALRIQHKPAIPRLTEIEGARVVEVKSIIDGPRAVACVFGKTVYLARWRITYRVVDGYFRESKPQENPAMCCEEDK